jgi:hypothetical protein
LDLRQAESYITPRLQLFYSLALFTNPSHAGRFAILSINFVLDLLLTPGPASSINYSRTQTWISNPVSVGTKKISKENGRKISKVDESNKS